MNIILNGKEKVLKDNTNLSDLLDELSLKPETLVIELNNTIIQPDAYHTQQLNRDDRVEIIRFVGGG